MAVTESKVEQEDETPKGDNNRQGELIETLSIDQIVLVVVIVVVLGLDGSVSVGFDRLVPAIIAVVSTCHVHDGMPISWFLHVSSVQSKTRRWREMMMIIIREKKWAFLRLLLLLLCFLRLRNEGKRKDLSFLFLFFPEKLEQRFSFWLLVERSRKAEKDGFFFLKGWEKRRERRGFSIFFLILWG